MNVSRQVEQYRRQLVSGGADEPNAAPGSSGRALNVNAGGAEGMAAKEQAQ
jgi:molybdopterin/thiamine biosynthesis adenylyltransferase